ncbi:MAG: response regulator, partial [Magnetospirillum sp.]|nr:response regulator [Magnetospirillum sp.]
HRADVAHDGAQALALVQQGEYDLVLMDMQMPNMDGLTAARAIRALPSEVASITIVAMTANAMDEDRESCLAAGMNDYISKPVDRQRLAAMLARWGHRRADLPVSPQATQSGADDNGDAAPLVDATVTEELMDALGEDYLNEVRSHFMGSLDQRVDEVTAALTAGDSAKAASAAHSIKGSAANLGYVRLAALAAAIEDALRRGDEAEGRETAQELPYVAKATRRAVGN